MNHKKLNHIKLFEGYSKEETSSILSHNDHFTKVVIDIADQLPFRKVHNTIKKEAENILLSLGNDYSFKMYTADGYFHDTLEENEDGCSGAVLTNLMLSLTDSYFDYEDGGEPYGGWEVVVKNGKVTYTELEETDW